MSKIKDNGEENRVRSVVDENIPMDKLFCAYMFFVAAYLNETLKQQQQVAKKKIEEEAKEEEGEDEEESEEFSIQKPVSSERSAQVYNLIVCISLVFSLSSFLIDRKRH